MKKKRIRHWVVIKEGNKKVGFKNSLRSFNTANQEKARRKRKFSFIASPSITAHQEEKGACKVTELTSKGKFRFPKLATKFYLGQHLFFLPHLFSTQLEPIHNPHSNQRKK